MSDADTNHPSSVEDRKMEECLATGSGSPRAWQTAAWHHGHGHYDLDYPPQPHIPLVQAVWGNGCRTSDTSLPGSVLVPTLHTRRKIYFRRYRLADDGVIGTAEDASHPSLGPVEVNDGQSPPGGQAVPTIFGFGCLRQPPRTKRSCVDSLLILDRYKTEAPGWLSSFVPPREGSNGPSSRAEEMGEGRRLWD